MTLEQRTQSIMPLHIYKTLGTTSDLCPTDRKFESYSSNKLKVEGCITLPTCHKNVCIDVPYYVIEAERKPLLLSGDASKQLRLIERVYGLEQYPELKMTTGTLPGKYSLKIDPSAKPVVHGPRRQPRALMPKIVDKLHEIERDKHIMKVTEPTHWVSSMVVVVKNGKVRICSQQSNSS